MDMNRFFNYVFEYRQNKASDHLLNIKQLLGSSMASAFENIKHLYFFNKPDYKLLKILIATTESDEEKIREFEQRVKECEDEFPVF